MNTCSCSPYVTFSLTRGWVRRLQLLLALASAVILGSESRGTHDHILLSQIWDSPNLEGQVPVFISPRNRVAQLYPQALGSLSVASFDSQDCGGGIRTRLHTDDCFLWTLKVQYHVYSSSTMGSVPSQMNLSRTLTPYFDSDSFIYTSVSHLSSLQGFLPKLCIYFSFHTWFMSRSSHPSFPPLNCFLNKS
jgi:hypothetical protein